MSKVREGRVLYSDGESNHLAMSRSGCPRHAELIIIRESIKKAYVGLWSIGFREADELADVPDR